MRHCRTPLLLPGVLLCLAASPFRGLAQEGSLQGLIVDAATSVPVDAAAIVLEAEGRESRATTADRNGFYQLGRVQPGAYTLRVNHIGFREHVQTVRIDASERATISIRLEPAALALEALVVTAGGGGIVREAGRQRVTGGDLDLVPVPAASGDLASYLQTLPGVVSSGDSGGQLFIRGGTPAENLVLVDGLPIYQPFHMLGFFSAFPEELVGGADFFAGGFGARYSGRTSSVLDVQMRDGNLSRYEASASASPFLAQLHIEGPVRTGRSSWMFSSRRSMIEETSPTIIGREQPIAFQSQYLRLSTVDEEDSRCSAMALRTADRGRLDPEDPTSRVEWSNLLVGGRCAILVDRTLRLVEVSLGYSSVRNRAVSRGTSEFDSGVSRLHHEAHTSNLLGATPFYAGYTVFAEEVDYDLTELFGIQRAGDLLFGMTGYAEAEVPLGDQLTVRPGAAVTFLPSLGFEPRLRMSWRPPALPDAELYGNLGVYRQDLAGLGDSRDVSSVFVAWTEPPDGIPLEARHALVGWRQPLGSRLQGSIEGYYKQLRDIPIPVWRAVANFTTELDRADGQVRGLDARLEYRDPVFRAFVGYGLGRVEYRASQEPFGAWFGEPVQRYSPAHDRRHQLNMVGSVDIAGFRGGARWQFGSGLPFTQPIGFDEVFDFRTQLQDVRRRLGTSRLILDRPFKGRLPAMHRLDLWLERSFPLAGGILEVQGGAINTYDRTNIFYYDLYSGRRVDQLAFTPYLSIRFGTE